MSSPIIITGAPRPPGPSGAPPPMRLNITDLVRSEIQWSLFIRALIVMATTTQENPISHFQIGGIHGLPPTPWQGSGGSQSAGSWKGYCTHGTVLFPTWHRPYVALYEQAMQQHAAQIAEKIASGNTQWRDAALMLRLPYWDWASASVPGDEFIRNENLNIAKAGGGTETVKNPLLSYTFNPIHPSFPSSYKTWPKTLRHPTGTTPSAVSNVDSLGMDLSQHQGDWRGRTFRLLTQVRTWKDMSNHTATGNQSLESIHDNVHVSVGGMSGGHMSSTLVAGFDPIFFLHHCNVDHLLSLWQAIHVGVYVTSGPAQGGTWTIPDNKALDASTGLTPFWNAPTTVWNSTNARETNSLVYDYPEFEGLRSMSPEAVSRIIVQKVNALYGSSTPRAFSASVASGRQKQKVFHSGNIISNELASTVSNAALSLADSGGGDGQHESNNLPQSNGNRNDDEEGGAPHGNGSGAGGAHPGSESIDHADHGTGFYDWSAHIRVKQYECLGSSFRVLIFLGDVPSDPSQWISAPSFVGSHACFVNSLEDVTCANCQDRRDAGELTEGFVYLNDTIIERSGLHSLDVSEVEPYLKQNLHWRVQKAGDEVVRNEDTSSLVVEVQATWLSQGPGEVFPVPSDPLHFHDITRGKAGGHR